MYAKPGRLLEALDKVRKADAVAETTTRKPGRLAMALQKVKETYAAEAGSVSAAPRGVKAFTRIKAAAAEAEVIAADDVVAKLTRRVNKMANLTPDVVKPQSPAPVEVKLPVLREPEKEKEVRVMTPRMRFIVEMSAKPASPRTVLPSIEIRREVTLVRADDDSRTYRISRVRYSATKQDEITLEQWLTKEMEKDEQWLAKKMEKKTRRHLAAAEDSLQLRV